MRTTSFIIPIVLAVALMTACTQPPPSQEDLNLSDPRGTFVIALAPDPDVRKLFEDRLVAEMRRRQFRAFVSYEAVPDVLTSTRDQVLRAARARNTLFILVAEEVRVDSDSTVPEKGRITHKHPTLKEFYAHHKPSDHEHAPGDPVFVEVSAFRIQEDGARLVWSGTTWSFQADGEGGAIAGITTTIADAIANERKRLLGK